SDEQPVGWTADGRSIFITKLSGVPGVISVLDLATGQRTAWKEFLPPDPTGVEQVGPAVITPDEKAYVYSYRRSLGHLYIATGMKCRDDKEPMTLAPGSKLGVYEILPPLGAGGMGEVYRARDARLSREIAIKVLPAEVATDPGRRQRFEQEARAASALN